VVLLALMAILDTSGRAPAGTMPWECEKLAPAKGPLAAPMTFEAGAARFRQGVDPFEILPEVDREYRALVAKTYAKALRALRPARHLPAVVNGVASDDERIARRSLQLLHDFCDAMELQTESGRNPINLELANSAQFRGGTFAEWREWHDRNAQALKDLKKQTLKL
jgi:hypothetical protein